MKNNQRAFIEFAINTGVLRFGEFTLKSGRISPYFFNAGLFDTGESLAELGRYYAQTIIDADIEFDMLYGPAYKGIPLVTTTAIALAENHNQDVPYAFNRKEAKHHAEGGIIVGAPLSGKVLIVDDVISAGLSVREAVDIIQDADATSAGVVIALDRQERGEAEQSAVQEIKGRYGLAVWSIINLDNLIHYCEKHPINGADLAAIRNYRQTYGA